MPIFFLLTKLLIALAGQYTQLVDINTRRPRARKIYRPRDFYGQLRNIVEISIPESHELQTQQRENLLLAVIRTLKTEPVPNTSGPVQYKDSAAGVGGLDVVDLTTLQCCVGRVLDRGSWVIIDRSGPYARATFNLDTETDH